MERVEFQQEDMVAELKDLEEKGLFSKVCAISVFLPGGLLIVDSLKSKLS